MADKVNFSKALMNFATKIDDLAAEAETLKGMWNARSHGASGTDEIEDADISSLPVTATILQAAEYSLEHFLLFLNNGTPAQNDHKANFEKCRNVDGEYTITLP